MKPIPDKAEIVLEYSDKFYSGTFECSPRFDARMDDKGVALTLSRGGDDSERKSVNIRIHPALFAEMLHDLAKSAAISPVRNAAQRTAIREAASALADGLGAQQPALGQSQASSDGMSADEEVALLHVLE